MLESLAESSLDRETLEIEEEYDWHQSIAAMNEKLFEKISYFSQDFE